jgi:hypothetical protein
MGQFHLDKSFYNILKTVETFAYSFIFFYFCIQIKTIPIKTIFIMSDKEIKRLTDLAKKKLKEKVSNKEALETFIRAGILDAKGHFTKSYSALASVVEKQ